MVWVSESRVEPRTLRTRGGREAPAFKRRATGGHVVQALFLPRLLPAWVPPHPASSPQLRARGVGGCGRAGCGHRPDRAEAPERWVRPRECSARTAVVERVIPAQGPDGLRILSQWFRDWTWPREGDQQQERALWLHSPPRLGRITTPGERTLLAGAGMVQLAAAANAVREL